MVHAESNHEKQRLRAQGYYLTRGHRWTTREELLHILLTQSGLRNKRKIPAEVEAIANELVELRQELLSRPTLIWDTNFARTDLSSWRQSLYRLLEEPDSNVAARRFNFFYLLLLVTAMVWNVIETLPFFREDRKEFVDILDQVFISIFSLEILVRLIAVRSWRIYLWQVSTWVDWVTVVSLAMNLSGYVQENGLLRWLVHFRPILRLLREARKFDGVKLLVKALKHSSDALMIPLFTVVLFALLSGHVLYVAERDAPSPAASQGDEEQPNIKSTLDGAWIVLYSVATVGYGNAPVTVEGKIIDLFIIIAGIIFLAIPISVVGSEFDRLWRLKELMTFMDLVKRKMEDFGLDCQDVHFIFRSFDLNADELLDFQEFGQSVRKVGMNVRKREILGDMFRVFDDDASGIINFKEFVKGLQGKFIFPSRLLFDAFHGFQSGTVQKPSPADS